MNKKMLAGILVLIAIIVIGVVLSQDNKQDIASDVVVDDKKMEETQTPATNENAMMEKDKPNSDAGSTSQESMVKKAGAYKDYSESTVKDEQAQGQKVVLFFHAPWCPFCKAADSAFKSKLGEIPSGVTVLKTDYDSNTDLKKKYGVTYQHTFVQIDQQGNMVTKWNGGDIDSLKTNIK